MCEPIPCFECDDGELRPTKIDYEFNNARTGKILVPQVPMLKCSFCGEVVIGEEGNDFIEAHINAIIGPKRIYRRLKTRRID
jgi:YgiT-type zinc finger domain-containing protein